MDKDVLLETMRGERIAEKDFLPFFNALYEEIWQNLYPPQILTNDLSIKIAKNVITPADTPVPDCQTCGVCCNAMLCVGVRPEDDIAAEDYWDIVSDDDENLVLDRFLRRDAETLSCIALEGELGIDASCRIYETRPKMCHLFDAGSDKCHALRRAYGIEPYLDVTEMIDALEKLDSAPPVKSAERISFVKFEKNENGEIEIAAVFNDNSAQKIHTFNPHVENFRRFEFDNLTLEQAQDLINQKMRKHD